MRTGMSVCLSCLYDLRSIRGVSTLSISMSGFETKQDMYAGFVTIRVNYGMSSLPYDNT
jgi:hypothetical protein